MRVFCVILVSIGSDNLKEFVIGCSTVRKVIESQEICDRSSNRTEGDRLQKFVIGDPIVRKVIDSKKFVTGHPTVPVMYRQTPKRTVIKKSHRIGHVNLLETYATSRQKIQRCSNSRGFHFFILFQKKLSKVLKTCSKTGILNVCMLKPNAIIGGSFWRSFQIHKNQVLKNTVDRTHVIVRSKVTSIDL